MLTLFATPKPFDDSHIATIQRNAIRSWTLLRPACEVILFGDENGIAEIAAELGVRHVSDIARNEYGTPLVSSIFGIAEQLATHDTLGYVNADIILMSDFIRAAESISHYKHRFLMVGQRWDLDVKESLDFNSDWEEQLRMLVAERGQLHPPAGSDYFVFPRGLWQEIPPFAVGRPTWDTWMLYRARSMGVPLIDATQALMAVHQNHGYSHLSRGKEDVWHGPEAKRNLELAGGVSYVILLDHATYLLKSDGVEPTLHRRYVWQYMNPNTLPLFYPFLKLPIRFLVHIKHSPRNLLTRLRIISYEDDSDNL